MHTLTRRHIIATLTGSAVMLCPAILNAQAAPDWGSIPTAEPVGQDQLITLPAGPADVDVSTLQPGEVAVVARPTDNQNYSNTGMTQYIAVMRRSEAQIAFGDENDRPGTVQDPRYLVIDLLCPHRGKAIGLTGNSAAPFACTDQRSRHGSVFDASGFGIAGASDDEYMSVPAYTIAETGGQVIVSLT